VIGGMVGKLTKIAQGETITHANRSAVNTGILADIAAEIGVSAEICTEIRQSTMARYASERMEELDLINPFYQALGKRVIDTLHARYKGKFHLCVLMCDFDGNKLAEVAGEV
jgi:cobalt-precorrin-5B (C1)-methyltransferase